MDLFRNLRFHFPLQLSYAHFPEVRVNFLFLPFIFVGVAAAEEGWVELKLHFLKFRLVFMVLYVDVSDFVSDCELAYGPFLFPPQRLLIAILSNLR